MTRIYINLSHHYGEYWSSWNHQPVTPKEPELLEEIKTFLENNPAPFGVCFIKHGFHRAVSMIGRMINGKSYIPFYVKDNVVNPPTNFRFLDK